MDLARLELGLLVAVMLPRTFPGMNTNQLIGLMFTVLYGAYAIFPAVHGWRSWVLWALTILVGIGRVTFRGPRQSVNLGAEGDGPLRLRQIHTQSSELLSTVVRFARSGSLLLTSGFILLFSSLVFSFFRQACRRRCAGTRRGRRRFCGVVGSLGSLVLRARVGRPTRSAVRTNVVCGE